MFQERITLSTTALACFVPRGQKSLEQSNPCNAHHVAIPGRASHALWWLCAREVVRRELLQFDP
jgi:hypothetical protein